MRASEAQLYGFSSCLDKDGMPDFTIKIDDFQWKVHSSLISEHSKFFENICKGHFKEAIERVVVLHDDCPFIIARMIQFFYNGKYERQYGQWLTYKELLWHYDPERVKLGSTSLATMMKRWELEGNMGNNFATLKKKDSARTDMQVIVMLYRIADKYDAANLRCYCQNFFAGFPQVRSDEAFFKIVDILGISTMMRDPELVKNIIKPMCSQYNLLPAKMPKFRALIQADAEFALCALDTMQILHQELDKMHTSLRGQYKDLCETTHTNSRRKSRA